MINYANFLPLCRFYRFRCPDALYAPSSRAIIDGYDRDRPKPGRYPASGSGKDHARAGRKGQRGLRQPSPIALLSDPLGLEPGDAPGHLSLVDWAAASNSAPGSENNGAEPASRCGRVPFGAHLHRGRHLQSHRTQKGAGAFGQSVAALRENAAGSAVSLFYFAHESPGLGLDTVDPAGRIFSDRCVHQIPGGLVSADGAIFRFVGCRSTAHRDSQRGVDRKSFSKDRRLRQAGIQTGPPGPVLRVGRYCRDMGCPGLSDSRPTLWHCWNLSFRFRSWSSCFCCT